LKAYVAKEEVEKIIIGLPYQLDGSPTDATPSVLHCIRRLKNSFPNIPVVPFDEQFSSKLASRAMVELGMKKKDRQKKELIDEIAATILLQEYMQANP
jgi:putative Holliday junction resolvase